MSSCYGHTLKLYTAECTDNAARTKDKHQSDSEERHTRELHNSSPRLYIHVHSYLVYHRLYTCTPVMKSQGWSQCSVSHSHSNWCSGKNPCKEPENSLLLAGRGQHSKFVLANSSQVTPRGGRRNIEERPNFLQFFTHMHH